MDDEHTFTHQIRVSLKEKPNTIFHTTDQNSIDAMRWLQIGRPIPDMHITHNIHGDEPDDFLKKLQPRKIINYHIRKYDGSPINNECSVCLSKFSANKKVAVSV